MVLICGDEADCAASTKGAAKSKVALMLVYTLWAAAARYGMDTWAELPAKPNPADLPSGARELPVETEPKTELASIDGLVRFGD